MRREIRLSILKLLFILKKSVWPPVSSLEKNFSYILLQPSIKKSLLVSILFFACLGAQAIDLTKQDFKYLYDPYSPVGIKHKLTQTNGDFTLYIMLNLKNPLRQEYFFEVDILAQKGYKDKGDITVDAELIKQDSTRKLMLLKYQFNVDESYDLLVGNFLINSINYYYDIPINAGLKFPTPEIVPLKKNGWPYFDNYLVQGSTVDFGRVVYTFQYNDQFGTAMPPMASDIEPSSNTIKIDSSFVSTSFSPDKERILFFSQTDSSSNAGCSFLSVSPYYPKLRRIDDLAKSILYLCKKEEYEKIEYASDTKKEFDRFWTSLVSSPDRARSILKRYFTHVTHANSFFTNYKEGWRTDRGMIYIIYGNPREVTRSDDKEIWTYTINGKKQNFNFAKVPNLFVQHHYVLIRDKDLSKVWLNEVGIWRKGNM